MPVPKNLGAIKRFGARYGRSLKQRFVEIENLHRKKYRCPYCSNISVRRISRGIWQCRKCDAKFAAKAYTITKKKTAKELAIETTGAEAEEAPKEAETIIGENMEG